MVQFTINVQQLNSFYFLKKLWKKMVSFAFLLISTLLCSSAIAAPYPDATDDTAVAVDNELPVE